MKNNIVFSGILLLLVVLSNTSSQLLLKAAAVCNTASNYLLSFFNFFYIFGLLVYFVSFCLWQIVLKRLPLTVAHPFCSLVFLTVPYFCWLIFDETITLNYVMGSIVICLGVCMTSYYSINSKKEI